jgi:NAD-dependent SIR2 family protein deacetylase
MSTFNRFVALVIKNRSLVENHHNMNLKRLLHSLSSTSDVTFVHNDPSFHEILELSDFVNNSKSLVCITGAGVSTSSGLPDYRGENGSYKRGHKPMVHSEFISNLGARQRYWTRSMVGFEQMNKSLPNDCHNALASLEHHNKLNLIITQNVDGLHQKASSQRVIDLHGRIDEIVCLQCGALSSRETYQAQLHKMNPHFSEQLLSRSVDVSTIRADGDVDLGSLDHSAFCVPGCQACGGTMKPHVVFFGDTVPPKKVEDAYAQVFFTQCAFYCLYI